VVSTRRPRTFRVVFNLLKRSFLTAVRVFALTSLALIQGIDLWSELPLGQQCSWQVMYAYCDAPAISAATKSWW